MQRDHLTARRADYLDDLGRRPDAPSRANVSAVARPMLPPVPVPIQTFPASRPGRNRERRLLVPPAATGARSTSSAFQDQLMDRLAALTGVALF